MISYRFPSSGRARYSSYVIFSPARGRASVLRNARGSAAPLFGMRRGENYGGGVGRGARRTVGHVLFEVPEEIAFAKATMAARPDSI